MIDLLPGDRIDIEFVDSSEPSARATVRRFLSDQEEGLSTEAEIYISGWMEITSEGQDAMSCIAFTVDWKCYLDGREVQIRKCAEAVP